MVALLKVIAIIEQSQIGICQRNLMHRLQSTVMVVATVTDEIDSRAVLPCYRHLVLQELGDVLLILPLFLGLPSTIPFELCA